MEKFDGEWIKPRIQLKVDARSEKIYELSTADLKRDIVK